MLRRLAELLERSIDIETYDRHAEKLREELTLARIDRHSGQLEKLDVEGILAFAERVLPRAADLWVQASLEQRQRPQHSFRRELRSTENGLFDPPQLRPLSATCRKSNPKMPKRASPVTSSPAVAKGKVVVATADGQVICFG